jgi:glycyl-tRNA synthetase beta chain
MAELFIEIFGEEIPARMQPAAEQRFADGLAQTLKDAGLGGDAPRTWSGPRRLAVSISGVALTQPDLNEERRGPRADAPEQAIAGFLKGAGITRDEAEIRPTPKGDFLFAVINKKGQDAAVILPEMIRDLLMQFSWPKSMRWGRSRQRWVRPLHRVSVIFDGKPLAGELPLGGGASVVFSATTLGHRMLSPEEIALTGGDDYDHALSAHQVIADRQTRIDVITQAMTSLTEAEGFSVMADEGLMADVAGLVEYPHPIMGQIDDSFMALPPEILVVSMRSHQKYFAVSDADGNLAPRFITIANMAPDSDRDAMIRAGNERVLKARLADARFFWDQDCGQPLIENVSKLSGITFFEGLGSMGDKAQRISSLAASIAAMIGADAEMAKRAGLLAKADLVSETVGEFPELQGVIGGYLAERDENKSIAQAIAGHYRPEGPGDAVPEDLVTIAVALSDKIDSLTGFFGIGEFPTGSKDPFALRRAALSVLRLITHNKLELRLKDVFDLAAKGYGFDAASDALMPFLHDRLKVWLRDESIRHDVVAAVLRLDDPRHDDLMHLCRLAKALADVLETEDGQGLMAGYRRASNILNAEEKKDQKRFDGMVDVTQLSSDAEITLNEQINSMAGHSTATTDAIIDQINRLGGLRAPIDAFFENTTVNDDDQRVRENRLNLLGQVRQLMEVLANFSAIEG